MVNEPLNGRRFLWILLPCAVVLILAAWSRGAEYDEQYTLFLTSGVARPDWPTTVFPAGLAREYQAGHAGLSTIGHDLRVTDVHPPLYFWLVSFWRAVAGDGLFVARLFSVAMGLGALALIGVIARSARLPPIRAILLTLGCYGFTYTSVIARGFALAQVLLMAGVACILLGRRSWHFAMAGALFGAATLTNYLTVFTAGACLLPLLYQARFRGLAARRASAAVLGFLVFIPADLWWFLAQRGSRDGQFPPFSLLQSVARLAGRSAGAVLGGLPLYVEGVAASVLTAALGLLLLSSIACVAWRWRGIGTPGPRILFGLAAVATPLGLLVLGALFDNTPLEVRYLTFSIPFVALLLAGALGSRWVAVLFAVQTASIMGLMLAPQTMQPARAAARMAAALAGDGIVLVPRGNDGVGVTGAFAIEAPPAVPLLSIREDDTPETILARIGVRRRVVLALLEQDRSSIAASHAMRRAMLVPGWREVARGPNVAVYVRTDDAE